jgi:ArsR family metal-binding transcriptional regulator
LMMDYGPLFLAKKLTVMMDLRIKQQMDMDLVIIIKLIQVLPCIGKDQMLQLLIMLGLYLPVILKFKSINRLI